MDTKWIRHIAFGILVLLTVLSCFTALMITFK